MTNYSDFIILCDFVVRCTLKCSDIVERCGDFSSEEIFVAPPRRQATRRPQNNMRDDDHMNTRTNQTMYTRGGRDSRGSCPGSLDDCIETCPATPVGGHSS